MYCYKWSWLTVADLSITSIEMRYALWPYDSVSSVCSALDCKGQGFKTHLKIANFLHDEYTQDIALFLVLSCLSNWFKLRKCSVFLKYGGKYWLTQEHWLLKVSWLPRFDRILKWYKTPKPTCWASCRCLTVWRCCQHLTRTTVVARFRVTRTWRPIYSPEYWAFSLTSTRSYSMPAFLWKKNDQ